MHKDYSSEFIAADLSNHKINKSFRSFYFESLIPE